MNAKPLFIFSSSPRQQPVKIGKLFEPGEGSVMETLRHPGSLRYAGWDLETLDTPRIIKGQFLEVTNGDRKVIRVYEDGVILFRALADQSFLGWSKDESTFIARPRLSSIAVVEITFNFVDLVRKLLPHLEPVPKEIDLSVTIKNAHFGSSKLYLNPYGVNAMATVLDNEKKFAPEPELIQEVTVRRDDLLAFPARVGYQLLEKIYVWFGFQTTQIPYVSSNESGERFIDIEKIKTATS